jgi:chromosome segregation ATPase
MNNPQPVDFNSRLNKIEDEFETVKQLLISAASYAESANKRIDRLTEKQDITQRQLDGLAVTVQVMGEKVDNFVVKVDESFERLNHRIDDFVETTTARNAVVNDVVLELRDSQESINAALQRMEAMLMQLVKRNGD